MDMDKPMNREMLKSQESDRDYNIRMNPVLTKDEVLPEHGGALHLIKERYLGLDEEHVRRWQGKYKFLDRENLQEVYISEQQDPADRLDRGPSADGPQSMDQSIQYAVTSIQQEQINPFDLPRNKLITSNSKASLSPSSLMPGGIIKDLDIQDIKRRHKMIKTKRMTKHHSKETVEAGIHRNLSQKTIATLMTVQEEDYIRKRAMKKREILQKMRTE